MRKRLDNKGNTLAIVLIGIFILSILGTLILGITSTNYNMKLNDKKTEMVFYHTEKAADELYAEIGNEVMTCVKESYIEVIENAVSKSGTTYTDLTKDEIKQKFNELYIDGKVNAADNTKYDIKGIKVLYPEAEDKFDDVRSRLEAYIENSATGYTFSIKKLTGSNESKIEYVYKKDPTTGLETAELETIELKNICIECKADRTGNYVNLVTDFTIKIPDVSLDFTDTQSSISLDDLYSYALIAQGNSSNPVLTIDDSVVANVKGNVYAGAYNKSSTESIFIAPYAKLNCNSQVIYCEGRFVLRDGIANLNSITGLGELSDKNTLQFFTNNISTEEGGLSTGSELTVLGNCIVEDDLEVNDDNTTMNLSGNYYGYGFRGDIDTKTEDNSNSTIKDFTNTTTIESQEHLESSAIIINAKDAKLDLTGLKQLILAGRAYIDLDESQAINTSYMTGESISYKGNQVMYAADSELSNATISLANGMKYSSITSALNKTAGITYSDLGLNSDEVIAKKVGEKMYFYKKQNDPVAQTDYFKATFNVGEEKFKELQAKTEELNVTLDLDIVNTKIYTVGCIEEVKNGKFATWAQSGGTMLEDSETDGNLGFYNILKDIKNRKEHLIPTLNNVDSDGEKILGQSLCEVPTSIAGTPYEYYLSDTFRNGNGTNDIVEINSSHADVVEQIRTLMGVDITNSVAVNEFNSKKIGYAIINDSTVSNVTVGDSTSVVDLDIGIIITTKPVQVKDDFVGMIITGESIEIVNNASIEANEEIAKLMFTNFTDLMDVINPALGSTLKEDTSVVEIGSGLSYEDLVEKSNWRKNVY